jgi:uncharacterized beta-barrel protein YwiB (DUF1934 family)
MQNLTIQLTVTHSMNGQTERTVMEYQGKAAEKETGWYVMYTEQLDGVGDVSTILKIGVSDVTLLRQGSLQMKQLFRKGKSMECDYDSPHGRFRMETHTRKLRIERMENRPERVYIAYQLWMNEQYLGEYELELRLTWL